MSEVSVQAITDIVLLKPWLGAAPASVFLQAIALIRLKGALHSLSVMLTVITGAVFGVAGAAFYMDPGNMWQILLIMGTPPLLVLTVGLLLMVGLIWFRGHLSKGGYDVQNGITHRGKTRTPTVQ